MQEVEDGNSRPENLLIGRERELRELRAGLRDALAGSGRLFLVSGDPGIGKTRLADAIAADAAESGATVLWGRCWEGGGSPAYWPWMQIFRRLLRDVAPVDTRELSRANAHLLAHLVPEMRDTTTLPAVAEAGDPIDLRFRLFDAAQLLLQSAAAGRPLVLIVDDLHAADQTSLLLLRFVARALRGTALLVIATYREAELRTTAGLVEAIAELARDGRSLPLRGLSQVDVGRFIAATTGMTPSATVVAALHGATAGNPFFLDEVVRLMQADGRFTLPDEAALSGFAVPDQVREAVRRQLRALPHPTADVLATGAVIGQEFALPVLERVAEEILGDAATRDRHVRRQQLLDGLGTAIAAGVLHCVSEAGARYQFAHALFREALYDGLTVSARTALHGRVADAIEALVGSSAEPPLAELAHHYATAGSAKGLDYAQQTADDALRRLAYEDAVHWYEIAYASLGRLTPDDDQRRLTLLLGLGEATKGTADFKRSRAEFGRAADLARALKLPEPLAYAAIGVTRPWLDLTPDPIASALIEEALNALDARDSRLRVRLLLLRARPGSGHSLAGARALIAEAIVMARRLDDPSLLAQALLQEQSELGRDGRIDAALAIGAEAVAVAEGTAERETALYLRVELLKNYLWRGDIVAVDAAIREFTTLAATHRKPFLLEQATWMRAMRAALEGHFASAEELAEQAFRQESSAPIDFVRALIRRERGTLSGHADISGNSRPFVRAALAVLAAEGGDAAAARAHLEHALAARTLADAGGWVNSSHLAHCAEACVLLDDRASARLIYDALLPHADLIVSFNFYFCLGAAARYLGVLATTLEEWDRAAEHFEAALVQNARLEARPWLAHTQHDYAALLVRALAADPLRLASEEQATSLAQQALATAQALGMRPLIETTSALLARLAPAAASPAGHGAASPRVPGATAGANTFRRDGEYWTVVYAGVACQLKDTKGLTYIAHLLSRPGEDIHATALVGAGNDRSAGAPEAVGLATDAVRVDLGDAGEVLDDQARAAYQRRLRELREELDEAESFNDPGRASRARAEIETLSAELSHAVGLGGRARRAGSHAERARVNVTRAIGSVLKKIAEHHSALASHLGESIKTGTFCSYQPATVPEWEL